MIDGLSRLMRYEECSERGGIGICSEEIYVKPSLWVKRVTISIHKGKINYDVFTSIHRLTMSPGMMCIVVAFFVFLIREKGIFYCMYFPINQAVSFLIAHQVTSPPLASSPTLWDNQDQDLAEFLKSPGHLQDVFLFLIIM